MENVNSEETAVEVSKIKEMMDGVRESVSERFKKTREVLEQMIDGFISKEEFEKVVEDIKRQTIEETSKLIEPIVDKLKSLEDKIKKTEEDRVESNEDSDSDTVDE